MKNIITFINAVLLMMSGFLQAQTNLDQYVRHGLENNEAISQQRFVLEKNLYSLKEANTLFLPTVALNGTYTLADGGRTIDFPVGDLFNPVNNSLNQLTGSAQFRPLENQSILLNPDNFYDAKIRTTLPLVNTEIIHNKRIKEHQISLQEIELNIYKRALVTPPENSNTCNV